MECIILRAFFGPFALFSSNPFADSLLSFALNLHRAAQIRE
jgi:hypothetical protein